MSIIFSDDLESYALNQDPFGLWLDLGFFKGKITTNTLNRNTGTRIYQMGLNGQLVFSYPQINEITAYWVGVNTPDMIIGASTTSTALGQNYAWLHVEADRTVSFYVNSTFGSPGVGVPVGRSVNQVTYVDTWQDYQVDVHTASAVVVISSTSTRTVLQVSGDIFVEGTLVVNVPPTNTDLDIASLPFAINKINNLQFSGNGFIDNLWATNPVVGTATFPFIGTGVNPTKARVTQGAVEVVKRFTSQALVTQGAVEVIKLPPRQARVTQGVIEVIKRGNTTQWEVYEA